MKTHKSFLGAAVLAAMVLVPTRGAFAQFPAGATMTVLPARGGSNTITVHDAGNRSWVLEVSTNFTAWTEAATWKIHNGSYHATVPAAPAGRAFYRAFYDSGRTGPVSTVASALRLPAITADYTPTLPPHYLAPPVQNQDNTPAGNPTTDLGATLGRVLFYDKRLSTNGTVSCSSCHQQQNGFSDPRRFSVGFNGGLTGRNSMGLANARYYPNGRFFWDERAATLEAQVLQPIQNSVEMGMTLPALVARLGAEPFYTNLFASVFGTPEVNTNRISRALAQFIRSMVSTGSKYDAGVAVGFTNFTAQELLGRQVFLGQVGNATCAACHGTDAHTAPGLNNNGLEFPYVDAGAGAITGRPQDNGRFKVPSLRNIALTAPYMHDGRFATLEEVVEFYATGVVANPNLPPPLLAPPAPGQPPSPRRLNLTAAQKAALVAFMRTLTDTNLATSGRFTDPFNYGN